MSGTSPASTEVAIIGGGIHGASAAYHLARSGVSVTLLERLTLAGGPTGRSSGVCRAYYTNELLAEVARDSIGMMADFERIAPGHDAGFRRTGFAYLHPPADAEEVHHAVDRLNALGIRVDILEADALARDLGRFNLEGVGVVAFEHDAGYADPAGTTTGMAAGAKAAGAAIRSRTAAARLRERPGGGAIVETDDGSILEAERLLIAAGPWTAALAAQLGVNLPLSVERHVVAMAGLDLTTAATFGHGDLVAGYYCRPEGEDQYCIGWTHPGTPADPDDFDGTIHRDEEIELLETVARRLPAVNEARPRSGWASLYDVSPDWQPVIGEIATGVFVDAGTSGHGFKLAPALARHVADLVLGHPDPRLAQFHPRRFETGELLAAGYRDARILG
jgi:glycine/D-amino acid oxidase-like deaminating enzyme